MLPQQDSQHGRRHRPFGLQAHNSTVAGIPTSRTSADVALPSTSQPLKWLAASLSAAANESHDWHNTAIMALDTIMTSAPDGQTYAPTR